MHDIYIGDEYYGESPLHMAIANEDKDMVKFIIEKGKQVKKDKPWFDSSWSCNSQKRLVSYRYLNF